MSKGFSKLLAWGLSSLIVSPSPALGQTESTNAPDTSARSSKLFSQEDGWLDVSGFMDEAYGFMPVAMPITEPAVGYGLAAGPMFISKDPDSKRPNITMVGGLVTDNGSWGALAGDYRNWLDGRLQTLAGAVYASVNLDYYGIGEDPALVNDPLRYNLEPKGGLLQSKYQIGDSSFWVGLGYAFFSTDVSFEAPAGTPNLPDFHETSNVGGLGPSFTFDTRDNLFTPTRGTYMEAMVGLCSQALGGDDEFQRAQLVAMQYFPLHPKLCFGLKGQVSASFGNAPFYMKPFVYMRGLPAMRYQGEEVAQLEGELRWQFWKRFSLVGFFGGGTAWNEWDSFERSQTVTAGGAGFRYEISRKYGIHTGLDVAFGPDDPTFYIQVGSAWSRP